MTVVFLFHTEDEGVGGILSAAFAIPVLDQFMLMYGYECAGIHSNRADYPPRIDHTFDDLEQAKIAYAGHVFIYLDDKASRYLDEQRVPADEVVYVAGHDATGFTGEDLSNGTQVKLRTAQPMQGHAIPCLIAAASFHWGQQWL